MCYTYTANNKVFHRGCSDPNDTTWAECLRTKYFGCTYCADDYCNSQNLTFTRRNIFCVTSKEPSANLNDIVPLRCEGTIPVGSHDYCYYLVSKNEKGVYDVTERGCYPYKEPVNEDAALYYCNSNGCNSYITHSTYMFCHTFNDAFIKKMVVCQNQNINFPAICYLYTRQKLGKDPRYTRVTIGLD